MADTRIATDTMKAFVFKQIGEVDVVKKPIPEPGPNEAVVRPALSFPDFMSTFSDLATSGKIGSLPPKDFSSLVYVSMLFVHYEETIVSVKPPAFVLKLLAFVGRQLGYRLD